MRVDIDMWYVKLAALTNAELQLLDRARAAAEPFDVIIDMSLLRTYATKTYVLIAHIASNPLRIDFALYERDEAWKTSRSGPIFFTGPQTPLTGSLFNENGFTPQFQKQIRAAVEELRKDYEGA